MNPARSSAPDVAGDTHAAISTGQADSKFGFSMADAPGAIARVHVVLARGSGGTTGSLRWYL
jgi:diaminopimelate decarboxylase